jgi:Neuraminidase (sialidase)
MGVFFPFPLYPYKFSHSKGQNSHLQISRLQIFIKPSITNFHINFFPQFHCDWSVRCEQSWFTLLHGTSFWINPFTYSAPIPILYVNSSICFSVTSWKNKINTITHTVIPIQLRFSHLILYYYSHALIVWNIDAVCHEV